jgi:hypothetical protein
MGKKLMTNIDPLQLILLEEKYHKKNKKKNKAKAFGKVNNCPVWDSDYLKVIPKSKWKESINEVRRNKNE